MVSTQYLIITLNNKLESNLFLEGVKRGNTGGSGGSGGLLGNLLGRDTLAVAAVQGGIPVNLLNTMEQNANAGSGSSGCAGNSLGVNQERTY